jgi:hypothetical protein
MLSVQTEIPEGGVVVRGGSLFGGLVVKRPEVATDGKQTFEWLTCFLAEASLSATACTSPTSATIAFYCCHVGNIVASCLQSEP